MDHHRFKFSFIMMVNYGTYCCLLDFYVVAFGLNFLHKCGLILNETNLKLRILNVVEVSAVEMLRFG